MPHGEEICTKISESVKMAGFLEKKKGKMKLVSPWKKYWFVLEERLLLYYRSQIEYINLSPCRGSLNMGLVTTVRPGSSTGPCIIHVITRTQMVQLRAKDRAMQEEWLQALLDSMCLPLFSKSIKTPLLTDLHSHRYSMDNIPSQQKKTDEFGEKCVRKEISDSFHGGSLDTATWSKKFRKIHTSSPNVSKGGVLEKILGYGEESDKSISDMVSLIDDKDPRESTLSRKRKDGGAEDLGKKPSETLIHESSDSVSEEKKSMNEGNVKMRSKEESQFVKIKNAMRKTRDKAFRTKTEPESKPSTMKKRRQSFLQKVFRRQPRIAKEAREGESDIDDPLYDTTEDVNVRRKVEEANVEHEGTERSGDDVSGKSTVESLLSDVQKPIFGSRSILNAQTMSELKSKLKSRESVGSDSEESSKSNDPDSEMLGSEAPESDDVPDLPPRKRSSRPKSPWHDVPVNNAPVGATIPKLHLGAVKFHDDLPVIYHDMFPFFQPETDPKNQDRELSTEKQRENDLSLLLEQLTEITSTSLVTGSSSEDVLPYWNKTRIERRFSDPDYDIPRPHKLVNLYIANDEDKLMKPEDSSGNSSSFHSIEPDSLESAEKKVLIP